MSHKQWAWMMDYCSQHKNPPSQSWAWDQAKNAYLDQIAI